VSQRHAPLSIALIHQLTIWPSDWARGLGEPSAPIGDALLDVVAYREQPQEPCYQNVCQAMAMRLHITLEDDLVGQLDNRVGRRRRSAFISAIVRRALDDEHRWDEVETSLGAVAARKHDWDCDPAGWVRTQRYGDPGRVG
jgi:hypothetical protein